MIKPSLALLPLLAVLACNGEQAADDTADTDTEVDEEITGKDGSVVLVHWPADALYPEDGTGRAVFVDDDQGIVNLAQCLFLQELCLDATPGVDDYVDQAVDSSWFDTLATYDAGNSVTAGPFSLPISRFEGGGTFYEGEVSSMPSGTGALEFNGELAAFAGTDAVPFPSPINVTSPDPSQTVPVTSGDTLTLEWETGGDGDVMVLMGRRVYHVEDDGTFDIEIDDYSWIQPWSSRRVLVQRATNTVVDAAGNDVRVHAIDEQWLYLDYEDFTGWTELTQASDDCAGAQVALPGQYYGSLEGFSNDIDLGEDNTITGWPSADADAFVGVGVNADKMISVTLNQLDGDASVYLMSDCTDASSAVAGTDLVEGSGAETVDLVSPTDALFYVGIDGYLADGADNGERYTLVIRESDLLTELSDTCAGASTAVGEGSYYGDTSSYADDVDLGDGNSHTGYNTSGQEGFVRIDLAAGETLTATGRYPEMDTALYALSDCSDATSVVASADGTLGGAEEVLTYTASGAETLYLAVDAWVASDGTVFGGQFRLDIEVE